VVRRSKLLINFPKRRLETLEGTIEGHQVPLLVKVTESAPRTYHTEIYDISDKFRKLILDLTLPASNEVHLQDIQIANHVVSEAQHWQNPQGQGRLWTDTDVILGWTSSSDYLEINFTVKWNTTLRMDGIPRRRVNRPALKAVLDAYFPDENFEKEENSWSAQKFYSSVHTPEKEDDVAASIVTPQLNTELYPFQKRSVRWLLEREGVEWSTVNEGLLPRFDRTDSLPYSFREAKDGDGQPCFVSHLFNVVVKDVEPYRQIETLRGGKKSA
jgi:E3 ubiquitin-protein ligase SHPRH